MAQLKYELMAESPCQYTSDDILFLVRAKRSGLAQAEYSQARKVFFSKWQACLRTSPLAKTYGFGIHSNSEGKGALFGMETEEYQRF